MDANVALVGVIRVGEIVGDFNEGGLGAVV